MPGKKPPVSRAPNLASLKSALAAPDPAELRRLLHDLHASDLADLLEALDDRERGRVVAVLAEEPARVAEALAEMEPEERPAEALAALPPAQLAAVVAELADDDAADLIGDLDPVDQARVLATLPHQEAGEIRALMRHAEDSAGGIMTTEVVAVAGRLSAGQAIAEVRRQAEAVGELYVVFVTGPGGVLDGFVPLKALVTAPPDAPVALLAHPVPAQVTADTDQEEVARLLGRYDLTMIPVVDAEGRLLGGVAFDDVLDVIEDEGTRDILALGGTSPGEELRGGVADAVRSRLPWLYANLLTAFLAAFVVYLFRAVVDRNALLAVCMPVIAGMGGNTGTQALAVTVRRLALADPEHPRPWNVLGKELVVGAANGLATAPFAAGAAWLLARLTGADPRIALVVLLAMWVNLAVGGFAGAFIPTMLERMGVDPAIASSIFVTTFTDMCGFFMLLGLAAAFLV